MESSLYQNYKNGKLDKDVMDFLVELSKDTASVARIPTPEEVRKNNSIMELLQKRSTPFKVDNLVIPGNGGNIPVRIYSPKGPGAFPVLVYFHGGGFVFGSLDEADHICSDIVNGVPAVVISIDYRLSPENKYPCAIEDAYASILWVAKEIANYNGDPKRIGVAGESAGANIATVVCQMLRDRGGPKVCCQLLICPWVDLANLDTDSYKHFGNGIWLSKKSIEYYRNQYLQNIEQAKEGYVSPLLAANLSDLPPAHIFTAEFDVLKDEGKAYAKRLLESGNSVTCKEWKGMIHSFVVLNKIIEKANTAIDECIEILRSIGSQVK